MCLSLRGNRNAFHSQKRKMRYKPANLGELMMNLDNSPQSSSLILTNERSRSILKKKNRKRYELNQKCSTMEWGKNKNVLNLPSIIDKNICKTNAYTYKDI